MALQVCPDCAGKVSSKADACIHCGCPVEKSSDESDTSNRLPVPELPENLDPLSSKTIDYLTDFYFSALLNPQIEQVVDGKLLPITIYENGFQFFLPKSKKTTTFHFEQVVETEILDKENFVEQERSFYGRSIAGGALIGGVGAILGAFSAQRKKIKNYSFTLHIKVYLPDEKVYLDYSFLSNSEKRCKRFLRHLEEYKNRKDQPDRSMDEESLKKVDYLWANDGK